MNQGDQLIHDNPDSQLVTLELESGNCVHFQPDTEAQCYVMPLHIYNKASESGEPQKRNSHRRIAHCLWGLKDQSHCLC